MVIRSRNRLPWVTKQTLVKQEQLHVDHWQPILQLYIAIVVGDHNVCSPKSWPSSLKRSGWWFHRYVYYIRYKEHLQEATHSAQVQVLSVLWKFCSSRVIVQNSRLSTQKAPLWRRALERWRTTSADWLHGLPLPLEALIAVAAVSYHLRHGKKRDDGRSPCLSTMSDVDERGVDRSHRRWVDEPLTLLAPAQALNHQFSWACWLRVGKAEIRFGHRWQVVPWMNWWAWNLVHASP